MAHRHSIVFRPLSVFPDRVTRFEPRTLSLRAESVFLVAILVCAAAARLATLGQDSLWVDEGYTQAITRLPFKHLLTAPYDNHPPGYFGLMKLWIGNGPSSEFSLRLPSAIASILTLLPTYLLARHLMGNAGALAALAVYSCSFEDLVYAGDARSYALLGLYLVTSFLALHMVFARVILSTRLRTTAPYGWIGLYLLSSIAAVYTHNVAVLFVLSANALFVFSLLVRRSDDWWRAALFCILINSPVVLAWVPYALNIPGTMGWVGGWLKQPNPSTAIQTLLAVALPNWTGIGGALVSLAGLVTGLALLAWRRNNLFYTSLFLVLLFPLLVWATGFIVTPIFMERTVLVAQIGGAFLIGAVVAFVRSTTIAMGIFIVSFIPYAISACGYLGRSGQEVNYGAHLVQDWKGLMRAASGRSGPDAIILCDDFSYPTIRYYAHEADIFVLRSGLPVSLNELVWLKLYGLPVKDRLARLHAHLDKPSNDDRMEVSSWGEIGRRYKTVWTTRPTTFCTSDFEEAISRKLSGQGFSPARDISQTGIVAKLFVRNTTSSQPWK